MGPPRILNRKSGAQSSTPAVDALPSIACTHALSAHARLNADATRLPSPRLRLEARNLARCRQRASVPDSAMH